MEFGGFGNIVRTAERVRRTREDKKVEQSRVYESIEKWYGELILRLSVPGTVIQEGIIRPQDAPDPHIMWKFDNKNYEVILDFDSFLPKPSDQKISLTIKDKTTRKRIKVNVFRPATEIGWFNVNGRKQNTESSLRELEASIAKTQPDPEQKTTIRFRRKPRA